jgi:lipoprotein Spr
LKKIKRYVLFLALPALLGSCQAFKPLQSPASTSSQGKGSPFLENIVVSPEPAAKRSGPSEEMPELRDNYMPPMNFNTGISVDKAAMVQFRYAILLNTEVERLENVSLYRLIDEWWGTPYRYGGSTKSGIDCSAFAQTLMGAAFALSLPRTAQEQKQLCRDVPKNELTEGDLVFFNTSGGVSHVGIYLHNNKFVHASTSAGVIISDLDEPYWEKRFISAGRPHNGGL